MGPVASCACGSGVRPSSVGASAGHGGEGLRPSFGESGVGETSVAKTRTRAPALAACRVKGISGLPADRAWTE